MSLQVKKWVHIRKQNSSLFSTYVHTLIVSEFNQIWCLSFPHHLSNVETYTFFHFIGILSSGFYFTCNSYKSINQNDIWHFLQFQPKLCGIHIDLSFCCLQSSQRHFINAQRGGGLLSPVKTTFHVVMLAVTKVWTGDSPTLGSLFLISTKPAKWAVTALTRSFLSSLLRSVPLCAQSTSFQLSFSIGSRISLQIPPLNLALT